MLQVGGRRDLLNESLGAEDGGEFGAEDLYCHLAMVFQILGEIDRRHAARTELVLDAVAVLQCGGDTVEGVGHAELWGCGRTEIRGSGRWRLGRGPRVRVP